jgi:hypothetical protein
MKPLNPIVSFNGGHPTRNCALGKFLFVSENGDWMRDCHAQLSGSRVQSLFPATTPVRAKQFQSGKPAFAIGFAAAQNELAFQRKRHEWRGGRGAVVTSLTLSPEWSTVQCDRKIAGLSTQVV